MTINRTHLAGLQYARLVAEENWPQDELLHILDDGIAEAQSAPEAEPSAWMYESSRGFDLVRNRWTEEMRSMGPEGMTETPLYTHPTQPH